MNNFPFAAFMLLPLVLLLPVPSVRSDEAKQSTAEVTSQPYQLANLFIKEQEIVAVFRALRLVEREHTHIASYLSIYTQREKQLKPKHPYDLKDEAVGGYFDMVMEHLVANPLQVYNLMWRWVVVLPKIINSYPGKFKKFLNKTCISLGEVGENDMARASQALVRIQFVYRLNPEDLANGKIYGIQTEGRLSAEQMLDIARRSYSGMQKIRPPINREFATAIEWLESAKEMADSSFILNEITDLLRIVTEVHDLMWISPIGNRGVFPNEEFFLEPLTLHNKTGRQLRDEEPHFLSTNPEVSKAIYDHLHNVNALCRGEKVAPLTPAKENGSYTPCTLDHRGEAYFYLAPVRVELLHPSNPEVYIFHDVLSEAEMSFMKQNVYGILEASRTGDNEEAQVSNLRRQSSAWLWDREYYNLYQLSQRLSLITGLEVTAAKDKIFTYTGYRVAEAWQVGVYSPGGHYLPHEDASRELRPDHTSPEGLFVGRRIATAMFYLSDIQAGGRTVFPHPALSITPKKGSVAFWYNLDTAGNRLLTSLHAACPTILGIKWVSNKWIREGEQIFKRPCVGNGTDDVKSEEKVLQ